MIDFFSNKKRSTRMKCIVLYTFEYSRNNTKELFENLVNYLKATYKIEFKYAGFYDEKYDDKYGTFDFIKSNLSKQKWDDIVNFTLDTDNLREKKRTIGVEFNVSRPIHITLFVPDQFEFNITDFVNRVFRLFKTIYGFSYLTNENYWTTAYAIGDWQHTKGVLGIERLSKKYIEHWQVDCEKIQSGHIRDVYNENILSQTHLTRLVNGKSLEQYIVENNIGNLQTINQELSIWKLDDIQLQTARNYLYESEVIV